MNDLLYKALRQLMLNALTNLHERYSQDGCNDLFEDDPLLKDFDATSLKILKNEWKKGFPELADQFDGEIPWNISLIDLLIKKIEDEINEK